MKSLRVLHIIDHLGQGGAQTFLAHLLRNWPESSDEISLLGLGRQDDLLVHFKEHPEIKVQRFEAHRYSFGVLSSIRQMVEQGGYDIIHAQLPKSILACLHLRPRFSSRLILHEQSAPGVPFFYKPFVKSWSLRADGVIANSVDTARILSEDYGVAADRINVIHNSIEVDLFKPREKDRSVLQHLGIPEDFTVIGFIGRLHKQKGLVYLMKALAEVRQKCNKIAVVLVGNGPLEQWLESCIRQNGLSRIVHRVPFQVDIRPWASIFDIGVVPSIYEPFGIVALELSSLGIPVAASRVGGLVEIIEHKKTGLLVESQAPDALAKALVDLIQHPDKRRRLGEAAAVRAQKKFSVNMMAEAVRRTYLRALEKR